MEDDDDDDFEERITIWFLSEPLLLRHDMLYLSMLTQRLRDKQEITRQKGYDFDRLMDI